MSPQFKTVEADAVRDCVVSDVATIGDAVRAVELHSVAVICNSNGVPFGLLQDADLRRATLHGMRMTDPVARWANQDITILASETIDKGDLSNAVIVRRDGSIAEVRTQIESGSRAQMALVLAGGLGSRMGSLTRQIPKPLLAVAGRPMLEHVLKHLAQQNVTDVVIATNYLADQIEAFVGDGAQFGVRARYLREPKRMGTAGALSLLEPLPTEPIFVVNADVLTRLSLRNMARHLVASGAIVTMAVVSQTTEIPYGVIRTSDSRIVHIEEKPRLQHWCNAGVYVVSPSLIRQVPRSTYVDMTTMIDGLIRAGELVEAFPIWEYWRDAGTPEDMQRASAEIAQP